MVHEFTSGNMTTLKCSLSRLPRTNRCRLPRRYAAARRKAAIEVAAGRSVSGADASPLFFFTAISCVDSVRLLVWRGSTVETIDYLFIFKEKISSG